jgi:hypothetical protein
MVGANPQTLCNLLIDKTVCLCYNKYVRKIKKRGFNNMIALGIGSALACVGTWVAIICGIYFHLNTYPGEGYIPYKKYVKGMSKEFKKMVFWSHFGEYSIGVLGCIGIGAIYGVLIDCAIALC